MSISDRRISSINIAASQSEIKAKLVDLCARVSAVLIRARGYMMVNLWS